MYATSSPKLTRAQAALVFAMSTNCGDAGILLPYLAKDVRFSSAWSGCILKGAEVVARHMETRAYARVRGSRNPTHLQSELVTVVGSGRGRPAVLTVLQPGRRRVVLTQFEVLRGRISRIVVTTDPIEAHLRHTGCYPPET